MPTIRIDDEVYALLQADAEPFVDTPNSVLRRHFGLDAPNAQRESERPSASPSVSVQAAKISKLVEAGLLQPGEELVWKRPRVGDGFKAVVLEDGRLRLEDGSVHESPSGAARSAAGYEVNGWITWRRGYDGRTLDYLWNQYEGRNGTTGVPSP